LFEFLAWTTIYRLINPVVAPAALSTNTSGEARWNHTQTLTIWRRCNHTHCPSSWHWTRPWLRIWP